MKSSQMRIGLNLLFLIPDEVGGTETYASSLVSALAKLDHTNEYFLYINKESAGKSFNAGANFHMQLCPISARNRVIRFLWEQLILPIQARNDRLDLMHSLGYISPLRLPCASLVTIHDLNYLYIPEAYSHFTRLVQKLFVSQSAYRVEKIIVVSEFIRKQVIEHFNVSANKVVTIHEAADVEALQQDQRRHWPILQERLNLREPYFLALSSLSPHKNIHRMIEAFAQYKQGDRTQSKLVIGGHLPKSGPSLPETAKKLGVEQDVTFTGYLSSLELREVLAHALLFVFPSLYEGFGLPALEAMAVGTPVACSQHGSLPEVGGQAALYFDPTDANELADVLSRVIADQDLRQELSEQGRINLSRFSWEKTASNTLATYERVFTGKSKQ